jgi:predicted nucleotidyltransferase
MVPEIYREGATLAPRSPALAQVPGRDGLLHTCPGAVRQGRCRGSAGESAKKNLFGCIIFDMKQDVVLQILKQKNAEMTKQFGVKSLLLFGSVARNEATTTSDVDLLVEFNRPVGYFGLFALQDYLEELLGCSVDLGTPDSLKPYIRERVMGELIRVA